MRRKTCNNKSNKYASENQISFQIIICSRVAVSMTGCGLFYLPCHPWRCHSISLFSQIGASEWTMSREQEVSSCFLKCTWRPVAGRCRRWGPRWSCRPATSGRAATARPTLRNLYRNSVVGSVKQRHFCRAVNTIIVLPEWQAAQIECACSSKSHESWTPGY